MNEELALRRARLTTPRAAAIAGVLFSVLLITALVLIRISIPADPQETGDWLASNGRTVTLALDLMPFAGIAFLWFMGVVRDRLGAHEDRFFATVFLGSGLLFLAMLFASAAVAGGILIAYAGGLGRVPDSGTYAFGRAITYVTLNTYAMKMAGVFMISSCTLFVRTGVMPRWMAWLGYALALVLLLTINSFSWISLVFPLWVLMISLYILIENLRGKPDALSPSAEQG
jgi:hypothetical protein